MEPILSSQSKWSSRSRIYLALAALMYITCQRHWAAAAAPAPVQLAAKRAIQVNFNTKLGERYQVYRSSDGTNWTPAGSVITGTGSEAVITFLTEASATALFKAET